MNPVLEALLEIVEHDPLPAAHTSSHWKEHGQQTIVERVQNGLQLRASGFETVGQMSIQGRLLHTLERFSYSPTTSRSKSFSSIWKEAVHLTRKLAVHPNFAVLRSVCALSVLVDHCVEQGLSPKSFAVIGDGCGFLGALLRYVLQGTHLYCIDLPKILIFQSQIHEAADPTAKMALFFTYQHNEIPADINFVFPQDIEHIPEAIDFAINMASMQEMTLESVHRYFAFLRRRSTLHSRFYCVNRFSKQLSGGEVLSFYDYPWLPEDQIFMDGPCPYYHHFFAPYTRSKGPRVLGWRIPYVNYFDGPLMHRLVRLAPRP